MTEQKNSKENKKNKKSLENSSTTGHNWDGVSEYDVPTPRWWLIVWIICIIWAIIYWFFYPAWPILSGNTKGSLNWTKFSELSKDQKEIEDKKIVYLEQMTKKSLPEILQDEKLMQFALNTGKSAFRENCSACHGQGAQGYKGYPNLNDDDWLWGGKLEDIYKTLLYGIRSGHDLARVNQMPSFGLDKVLKKAEINDTIEYVLSLSNKSEYNANGEAIFKANCVACHGNEGKGNQELGAPNLTDAIWLYGSDKKDIYYTIYYARAGVMPYWNNRLDDNTIKSLSIYVHSGHGHTRGDTIAWVDAEKILFSGDLVEYEAGVYTGDAQLQEWPAALQALRDLNALAIVPGRGEAMKGQANVNKALDYTQRWVETLFKAGKEAVAAKMDLKAAMAHARKSMDPVFGHVFIYEHCLPFDVTRAFDEASGIKNPRIWTAERDIEMWKALQD